MNHPFRSRNQPGAFSRVLDSILEAGRALLSRRRGPAQKLAGNPQLLGKACAELVEHRGEASGLVLAREILDAYEGLSREGREQFFAILQRDFSTDSKSVVQAAERYGSDPKHEHLDSLRRAIESPCLKLFRRLNMAPGGTSALVAMRGHLLDLLPTHSELAAAESDLKHLLIAWFNRGFLELQGIDWDSSARLLEKIIEYEAVHEINGWDDLRNRLKQDRRLFAFFHPAMPDDPVIFVEIALGKGSANAIAPLIRSERPDHGLTKPDTATFYSISNCHQGLQGISFGNFLIKQVAADLASELPSIKRFETLSPVPSFALWLNRVLAGEARCKSLDEELHMVRPVVAEAEPLDSSGEAVRQAGLKLCAHYLLNEKQGDFPADPVARFHLGNGAALDQVHWAADTSEVGRKRSLGIMVNYLYEAGEIEKNHEAYFGEGFVVASNGVRKLARA